MGKYRGNRKYRYSNRTKSQVIDLGKMVQDILDDYGDEVERTVAYALPEVAEQTASLLRRTSPSRSSEWWSYANGWTSQTLKTKLGRVTVVVYNHTKPTLTHLLEFGHRGYALRNGGRTKDVPPKKHIQPRRDYAEDLVMKKIEGDLK